MPGQTIFELSNPGTWIPALLGGGLGIYTLIRIFKRDSRNDNHEKLIDESVQQIITNLRGEVERLTHRMTAMEGEIVRLHEERAEYQRERAEHQREKAELLAKVGECNAKCGQPTLL